jgi:DNA-binding CsgD family transcriptional regulator
VSLIDLRAGRLLALSPSQALLLGIRNGDLGTADYDDVAVRLGQAQAFMTLAARDRYFDGVEGWRPVHRPDGSVVELPSMGRVIALGDTRDLGLWVLGDTEAVVFTGQPVAEPMSPGSVDVDAGSLKLGVVADRWQVVRAEASAEYAGWTPPPGARLTGLAHPNDMAMLLVAMAAATTTAEVTAHLRWHVAGVWRNAVLGVSIMKSDALPRFELTLRHRVVRASMPLDEAALSDLGPLPDRQREVLVRLVRGERVGQIAREMYLSESTVRNHLVGIFRKAGVHSQQELLSRLRDGRPNE